jgi:voltage-gated potassium channel
MVTLSARELAPDAKIIASVREAENASAAAVRGRFGGGVLGGRRAGCRIAEGARGRGADGGHADLDAGLAIAEKEVDPRLAVRRGTCR